MVDTKGLDVVLNELITTMEEGEKKECFKKVLNETDEVKAQGYYDRLGEAYTVGIDLRTVDINYILEGKTTVEQVETYGLDKEVYNLMQTLPEGELKEAMKTVWHENDKEKAKTYYDRLAACWSATGKIDNISPDYLLSGTIKEVE